MSVLPGIRSRFEHSGSSFSLFTIETGGLPPCIVLYLSFFYPRKQMQIRYAWINVAVSYLTLLLGLRLSLPQHHWLALSPVCWPLLSSSLMDWVASPGGPGYSLLYVVHRFLAE